MNLKETPTERTSPPFGRHASDGSSTLAQARVIGLMLAFLLLAAALLGLACGPACIPRVSGIGGVAVSGWLVEQATRPDYVIEAATHDPQARPGGDTATWAIRLTPALQAPVQAYVGEVGR